MRFPNAVSLRACTEPGKVACAANDSGASSSQTGGALLVSISDRMLDRSVQQCSTPGASERLFLGPFLRAKSLSSNLDDSSPVPGVRPLGSFEYPRSYYAASANEQGAFACLEGDCSVDVCVVGGGFTGISSALHLAERGFDVALIEAGRIGWGASGRSGGQVGSGQRLDTLEMERHYGRETAHRLWALAEEAKAGLQQRIATHDIRCDYRPGNLLAVTKKRYLAQIRAEADNLERNYGYTQLRWLDAREMATEVASDQYCGGLFDAGGGHLHPLNLALGMAQAARNAGAQLYERCRADRIDWARPRPRVRTAKGDITARYVVLAGNGYLGALEPSIASKVMPIVNHIAATEPLDEARASALIPSGACVHATKFVVDYYRISADHRLLFGGGETYSPAELPNVGEFVRRYMLAVFPQLSDVRVDYAWSGTLAITMSRMPHFGRVGPSGFFAQGFSGHGVALTQLAGKLIAEAVAGTAERFDVFARLPHRRFPGGPGLRKPLLVAGMLYYALLDRL